MRDGLYKVQFQVPGNGGAGVIVMAGGKLRGGDSSMYYTGTYAVKGNQVTAQVITDAHTKIPGMASVFGIDRVTITLTGKLTGDNATLTGSAREAPNVPFQAMLTRIGD